MADLSPIHSGLGPVDPYGTSQLLSLFRVDSDHHFSESMVPLVRVIPCSHVRVFARRLGR